MCCRHEVPVTSEPITVIHMDEDVVVVNKPASIPVSGVPTGLCNDTRSYHHHHHHLFHSFTHSFIIAHFIYASSLCLLFFAPSQCVWRRWAYFFISRSQKVKPKFKPTSKSSLIFGTRNLFSFKTIHHQHEYFMKYPQNSRYLCVLQKWVSGIFSEERKLFDKNQKVWCPSARELF